MKFHDNAGSGNLASINSTDRIALFIDGASLRGAGRALGFSIDYKRLLDFFRARGRLIRAFYYSALVEDLEYSSLRPLIDWLDYNGYSVVTKPAKDVTDALGHRKIKANMDLELALDVMELTGHLDHVVLFSGEGDLCRLVEQVQRQGVRVTVVSTYRTVPSAIADELRRQADSFLDLLDLAPVIARGRGYREEDEAPPLARLVAAGA